MLVLFYCCSTAIPERGFRSSHCFLSHSSLGKRKSKARNQIMKFLMLLYCLIYDLRSCHLEETTTTNKITHPVLFFSYIEPS